MDGNMFPSVAGSTRIRKLKSEFPFEDEELEKQRNRLAKLKLQPTNVKRRRPASRQANRRAALLQAGLAKKPSKVILEPIRPPTLNELDEKLMDDSLRKLSALSTRTVIDPKEEKENDDSILKGNNDWKLGFKGDIESIIESSTKTGITAETVPVTRSQFVGTPPILRLSPSPGRHINKSAHSQNVFLPSVLKGSLARQSWDNVTMKKSLSESRLTTPRIDPLTSTMSRSVSIASLSLCPSIPQSPLLSLISTRPLIGSIAPPPPKTSETMEDGGHFASVIEAPSSKLSFSKAYQINVPAEIETQTDLCTERPISSAKKKQIVDAAMMIKSSDDDRQIKGVSIMHKHLLDERNPPIDAYLELQVVPSLAKYISSSRESLVLGALLALSGIVCGNHQQTANVVEENVLPNMVRLLTSTNDEIVDQCIICLGNIAGGSDDFEFKVNMFEEGVLKNITDLIQKIPKVERAQKLAWVLSNLSQPNYLPIEDDDMDRILTSLLSLLEIKDQNTNKTAMWVLSFITERSGNQINDVIEKGFIPIIFQKISQSSDSPSMLFPMLRVMGNIASGDHLQVHYADTHVEYNELTI